jgi:hypothetical protein
MTTGCGNQGWLSLDNAQFSFKSSAGAVSGIISTPAWKPPWEAGVR